MPANTSTDAISVRGENGSESRRLPRTTAIKGFTYEYNETVDIGRNFNA